MHLYVQSSIKLNDFLFYFICKKLKHYNIFVIVIGKQKMRYYYNNLITKYKSGYYTKLKVRCMTILNLFGAEF